MLRGPGRVLALLPGMAASSPRPVCLVLPCPGTSASEQQQQVFTRRRGRRGRVVDEEEEEEEPGQAQQQQAEPPPAAKRQRQQAVQQAQSLDGEGESEEVRCGRGCCRLF